MRPLVRDCISSIKPYVPGKPVEELERELGITGSVKLASNENPVGPSPKALEAAAAALAGISRYPDGSGFRLKSALSLKYGHPAEGIILGNGSNELLDVAVRTFMAPGEDAVMADPSFVVYKLATQAAGCGSVVVPLKDGRHDLPAMAASVGGTTKMVFIANPNNPTGTMNTSGELDAFMASVPEDVIVVLDEAYYEYVTDASYPDSTKYLKDGRNVIILRTFSKAYGLAGLRIGYGLAPAPLVEMMDRVRQPFNTGSVSQAAALAALGDLGHVKRSVEVNEEGKAYLYAQLDRLGIKYYPTHANFIYMEMDRDARAIYDAMLKKGVIIRPAGPRELRVTIGLPEENRRFVGAFEAVLNNISASN